MAVRLRLVVFVVFEEGRDMDDLYMAEWAGVDPETGSPQWYTTDEDGKRVLTNSYSEATGAKSVCRFGCSESNRRI